MRGIMFSDEMALAIKLGNKTQTRRLTGLKLINEAMNSPYPIRTSKMFYDHWEFYNRHGDSVVSLQCPYGVEGSTLYVKQRWRTYEQPQTMIDGILYADNSFEPIANTKEDADRWMAIHDNGKYADQFRPAMFMPSRWALQHIRIDRIEVQRLHKISDADIEAEGVDLKTENGKKIGKMFYLDRFEYLWDKINGAKMPWELNPWVWKLTFTRMKP